jgi:hypothetical protein
VRLDRAPQVRHSFSGLNREHSLANATKKREHSSRDTLATSFGTRGSQVQILPLRPIIAIADKVRGAGNGHIAWPMPRMRRAMAPMM